MKTVDSFQGLENEVIVLNMVRSGKKQVGFAARGERLNVALSRARQLLVLICDTDTFSYNKTKICKTFVSLLNDADVFSEKEFTEKRM